MAYETQPNPATTGLDVLERSDVHTVQFGIPDIDGRYRGKRVPAAYFGDAVTKKGSAIANILFGWDIADELMSGLEFSGWHTGYSDVILVPDIDTLRVVPWEPGVASAICDLQLPDGGWVEIAPRTLLRRQVERAERLGLTFSFGYELEFYLFRETPASLRDKGFDGLEPLTRDVATYDLHRLAQVDDVVGAIRRGMIEYGIPVEAANTEYGPGQIEVNLRYCSSLEAADRVLLYKAGVRDIAAQFGLTASFMAKILPEGAGSSGHVHQSACRLDDPDVNAFWDPADESNCSELSRRVIAGQLSTMSEMCAFYCPVVNSYKRRRPASWSPTTATWGLDNRTTALRAIARDEASCRIENRLPGADANPYLVIAACIAAALHGIETDDEVPAPTHGNAYEGDFLALPATLDEALDALERGSVARNAFGDPFVDHFIATRRWELEQFRDSVTDWERRRYLDRV